VPAKRAGELVFTAGQIPMANSKLVATGKVPTDVPLATAQAAARQSAVNALAATRELLGSLNDVSSVVRLNVFINSTPGFTDQAMVANGASELISQVFGQAGTHTRCAIGAAELPLNAPVEVDMILQVAANPPRL